MIITKIEKQKNNDKRYSIFIDYSFAFGIGEVDLLYYNLKENEPLDEDKYSYIMNKLLLKRAKDKALKYLGYKARSRLQVIKKLEDELFPQDVIEKVIKILEKYRYIDDDAFCKMYIKDKMNLKGYGPFKISYELKMLGIEKDMFEKYLFSKDFIDEDAIAYKLLEKKARKLNIINMTYKEKQKLFAYLHRRGFSYDCINSAFSTLLNNSITEDIDIYEQ